MPSTDRIAAGTAHYIDWGQFGVLNAPQFFPALMQRVTRLAKSACTHELMKSACIVYGEPLESFRALPSWTGHSSL